MSKALFVGDPDAITDVEREMQSRRRGTERDFVIPDVIGAALEAASLAPPQTHPGREQEVYPSTAASEE